jgi:hypothetical protein
VPPFTYGSVSPGLFTTIAGGTMPPLAAPQRQERH